MQAQLIEDLLDVSRIIAGKLRLAHRADRSRRDRGGARSRRCARRPTPRAIAARRCVIEPRRARVAGDPATACSRWCGTCCRTRSSSRPRAAHVDVRAARGPAASRVCGQRHGAGIDAGVPAVRVRSLPPGRRVDDAPVTAGSASAWRSCATSSSCTAAPCSADVATATGKGATLHRAPAVARGDARADATRATTPRGRSAARGAGRAADAAARRAARALRRRRAGRARAR